MGAIFNKLYKAYLEKIELNREKFENFNENHKGTLASDIFSRYWLLEGHSNSFDGPENEKIKLTTYPPYAGLPDELKQLVR
ncbi:MAG: hypothetical protein EOO90_26555 [Pedobacter sp.]|nr:MAG: hypothetical protein EOO90_26555 [Pedobacter sp.]